MMDAQERQAKLTAIATLPEGELRGWWLYVVVRGHRAEIEGERAALLSRARKLGIYLSEVPA